MLSIVTIEGTGSFNTNTRNVKQYSGNGPDEDYERDLNNGTALVLGKILGYIYYYTDFKKASTGYSDLYHYINWFTPIIDVVDKSLRVGVYAGGIQWGNDVRSNYNYLGGNATNYEAYVISLGKSFALLKAKNNGIQQLKPYIFASTQGTIDVQNPNI